MVDNLENSRWVWLSHVLDEKTPAYGGGESIKITPDKQMLNGDSCNTSKIEMPCHVGSHVDAPRHFVRDGKTITDYETDDWFFKSPTTLEFSGIENSCLLTSMLFENAVQKQPGINGKADIVLLKTGYSRFRDQKKYWESSPGVGLDLAKKIVDYFPQTKAVGMDFISVSCLAHREEGRNVHQYLLGKGIRLFEDLNLEDVNPSKKIKQIIAMPLRVQDADGVPCTLVGELVENI